MPGAQVTISAISGSGVNRATVTPDGGLTVSNVNNILLNDPFDGSTIDTVNRWTAAILAGGGTMVQSGGNLAASSGTTASAAAAISSIETFSASGEFITVGTLLSTEATLVTNTNRWFGLGTPGNGGAYTAALPITDGYGFEIDTTGAFGFSIYNASTRVSRTLLTLNPGPNFLLMQVRPDICYFFLNNTEEPVGTINITGPSTTVLPLRFHSINGTTGPSSAPTWSMSATVVIDNCGIYPQLFNGQTILRQRTATVLTPLTAVGIASETTIWTPTTGRKFRLMGGCLTSGAVAGNVILKDNTAGTALPIVLPFGTAGQPLTFKLPGNGYLSATAGNVLTATGAATQTLSGWLEGTLE